MAKKKKKRELVWNTKKNSRLKGGSKNMSSIAKKKMQTEIESQYCVHNFQI